MKLGGVVWVAAGAVDKWPAGATAASYIALRLPREVAGLFREWLEARFPGRAQKVMARVRELHGGRDYDPAWGRRMTGRGVHAALIARRFAAATARLGLARRTPPLRTDRCAERDDCGVR